MKPSSWRLQVGFIASGYAAVLVVAAVLLYGRYLWERDHAAEVATSSGMYAGGDALLAIFIACLFMIPTVFLVWFMAKFEAPYTRYSQLLLGVSLSAPVCLGAFYFGENYLAQILVFLCLFRLFWSPPILVGMGVSRLVARFDRAKRLTVYALLIEGLTLGIAVALLIRAWPNRG